MQISSLIQKYRVRFRLWCRWCSDRRGNLTTIFALSLIPIIAFVGAAVDFSRASSLKVAMQAAADATALMLSKDAATLTNDQLQTKANAYFDALFTRPEAKGVMVTATFTKTSGPLMVLNASSSVDTMFMGIMGFRSLHVAVNSQVRWGNTRLRVALVLDTTGSMADAGKMPAMQTATKNLITQLQNVSVTNGDVYISIIPFSKNVNVDPGNYNSTSIDWTDWEAQPAILTTWIANNKNTWEQVGPGGSCPFTTSTHGFRCAADATSTTIISTIPSTGTYAGYICPSTDTGGEDPTKIGIMYNGCYNSVQSTRTISSGWGASCGTTSNCSCSGSGGSRVCKQTYFAHTWRPAATAAAPAHDTWNGCVTDRGTTSGPSGDYDRKVTAPTAGIPATLFAAEQNSYCSPAIMQLSYDWSAMKNMVDGLYPLGATNQPIGLVWGWQSLVGGGPIAEPPAKASNYRYSEAIVLMSDGLNTLNRWDGNGSSTSTAVDQRMYQSSALGTCANIKAAGITIYTVQVNTGGDPKSTLLENCASAPDKFWMVTSAGALGSVFNQIATQLSQLRIAQ